MPRYSLCLMAQMHICPSIYPCAHFRGTEGWGFQKFIILIGACENITFIVRIFHCFILIILIQMEEEDDLEEMWLFQGLEHSQSQQFCFLSKKEEESIEEAINQFFAVQSHQQGPPETLKLETLSQPSSASSGEARVLRTRRAAKGDSFNSFAQPAKKTKGKRKIRPSPYHNYQKHLITAIKHVLKPPTLSTSSSAFARIEVLIWQAFMRSHNQTKKLLYFVFNEQNEQEVSHDELAASGFHEIYREYSHDEIWLAKSLMTQLALEQLNEESLDRYLSTRRIRDPAKFKRYIQLFLHQLEEGYIKKRLSDRHRILTAAEADHQDFL